MKNILAFSPYGFFSICNITRKKKKKKAKGK